MALSKTLVPIYFILAPSYHGAITLSARANQHPHILSLGNGNPLQWEDQRCACGEDVKNFCPFWTGAAEKIEQEEDHPLPNLLPPAPYITAKPKLNAWITGAISLVANEIGPLAWRVVYEQAERFFKIHDRFLNFAQAWAPHKVYLDAERSTVKCMVMASMGFPVKGVIHLVRDPRGYASAWKKYYPETTDERLGMDWAAAHTRIRRLAHFFPKVPFLTITYEELMAEPMATMEKMCKFMGLESVVESEMMVDSMKNHILGLGTLDHAASMTPQEDLWRETLPPKDQERVVRAAGPLFTQLGYKS